MKGTGKILITILMLTLVCTPLMSQTSISGQVNDYYLPITELCFREGSVIPNAVRVSDPVAVSVGDTVMVYQPKGLGVQTTGAPGEIDGYFAYTGKYSILIVHAIDLDTVIFNAPTGFKVLDDEPYGNGDVGQLIKVATYDNAVVTDKLYAKEWDPVTNTGGVLVVYIKEKLTLMDSIDVSGQGFKGAVPYGTYGAGNCYIDDPFGLDDDFYDEDEETKAGLKGEGAIDTTFHLMRGLRYVLNGGGGGNAKYSGGGGGSNRTAGGEGGFESDLCTPAATLTQGMGGDALGADLYKNDDWTDTDDDLKANRIFMGGGGGTGTQDPGYAASDGGNGGGIVIIIADTLEVNSGMPILARGDSTITAVATGAGGGGGAIILDVSHYEGNIQLSARGGDGGSTFNGANYTGPGGGGGGGIYWMRYDSVNVNKDLAKSKGGISNGVSTDPGEDGLAAAILDSLNVPLNGFLFNTLPKGKTVCSDERPAPINASRPKGGSGQYDYQWWYMPDTASVWYSEPEDTLEDYHFKGPLTMTTKYQRVVSSAGLTEGDDVSITYTVLQKIEGNGILASDTVCFGLVAIPFIQNIDSTLGGAKFGTEFDYFWINSTDDGATWSDTLSNNSNVGYSPRELETTTSYSRIIRSGVCDDTSNTVIVTVLPAVGFNFISQDTILCKNQIPDELIGTKPTGGDAALFSYKWEKAVAVGGPYTEVALTQHYQPPLLTNSVYYRRVFYSGIDDACKDTTDVLAIEVLPLISNNDLLTPEDTVCESFPFPDPGILADDPEGGDGTYTYTWQVSDDLASWGDSITYNNVNSPFNLNGFPAKRYIRRLVLSGADDVCQDTSDILIVNVIPSVNNNALISTDITICQDVAMPVLTANPVDGGDGNFSTLWRSSTDGTNFSAAAGTNDTPDSYSPGALLTTTYFQREVWSSNDSRKVCDTYSDNIKATVVPRIAENYLNDKNDPAYICYDTDLSIIGSDETSSPALLGGDGAGTYFFKWETSPTPIDGDFVDASVSTSNYFEASVTELQYLRRIVSSGVCEDTSLPLEVFVRRLPHGVLALDDTQDAIICESEDISSKLKVDLEGETGVLSYFIKVTYTSEEGPGTIDTDDVTSNPGIIEHKPFTDDSATFVYVLNAIVDNNGCVAPADSMLGSASIKVYQTPDAEIMPLDTGVCGPAISIESIADRGGVGHWIKYAGNVDVTFDPVDLESTVATLGTLDIESEILEYGWVLETPRCSDTAFVEIVHYKEPDVSSYTLKTDRVEVFVQDSYDLSLQANPLEVGIAEWTNIGSIGDIENSTIAIIDEPFAFESSQLYDFLYTVINGACGPYTDGLTINRLDLKIYDGFSPDGDEYNNALAARGLDNAHHFECYIFNTWGTLVKKIDQDDLAELGTISEFVSSENPGDPIQVLWKGSRKDDETFVSPDEVVDDGTYFYSINIYMTEDAGEEPYQLKGTIVVKTQ